MASLEIREEAIMRRMRYAIAVLLALGLAGQMAALELRAQKPVISYEAFVELGERERRERFDKYDPDTKSYLMRTHATKWLERNRGRLSKNQIALVQELIDFLSPSAFAGTPDAHAKSKALIDRLQCQLSHSDIVAAVRPDMTPPNTSWLSEIWEWLQNCVIG
jgi:hypothetical protein